MSVAYRIVVLSRGAGETWREGTRKSVRWGQPCYSARQAQRVCVARKTGRWFMTVNDRRPALRRMYHRWQAQVDEECDEREWDVIIRSPKGQETLRRLAAPAREEIALGEVEEVEEGGCGR